MKNKEQKSTILKREIKKLVDEFNNWSDIAEERTSDPKDNKEENIYTEAQKDTRRNTEESEKTMKHEEKIQDTCNEHLK